MYNYCVMKKYISKILFIIYMIILLRYTVFRPGIDLNHLFAGKVNLALFDMYAMYAEHQAWSVFFFYLLGNIVWFMPFGYYMQRTYRFHIVTCTFSGFLLSLLIESSQWILSIGVFEPDDLILNTLGAAAGAVIGQYLGDKLNMLPGKIIDIFRE